GTDHGRRPPTLPAAVRLGDGRPRVGRPARLPHRGANPQSPVSVRSPTPRDRSDRDGSQGPLPIRRRENSRDVWTLDGHRTGPADGGYPRPPLLSDDGGGEPLAHGGGTPPVGPEDGALECDVRGR